MIASSFRASDDSCLYPFNIPENLFALTTLKECKELLKEFSLDELVTVIDELITDISKGLDKFSKISHPFLVKSMYTKLMAWAIASVWMTQMFQAFYLFHILG